jgi:hypothetical protein
MNIQTMRAAIKFSNRFVLNEKAAKTSNGREMSTAKTHAIAIADTVRYMYAQKASP